MKKSIITLLSVVLLFALAGCGNTAAPAGAATAAMDNAAMMHKSTLRI